jgi:hypothetical protein
VGWGYWGWDSHAYWNAWSHGLYEGAVAQTLDAYLYSPAFAQLLWPLAQLPWPVFSVAWAALLVTATAWLLAPLDRLVAVVAFLFCVPEIIWGNVAPLLGVVAVLGFGYPALWAFAFLTKVVPGVGVAWFAVRREWRQLAVALAATLIVSAVSFALAPNLWSGWARVLLANSEAHHDTLLPLVLRAPVALLVLGWGALTDRRWVMPVAMLLAYPVLTVESVALLAAIPRLRAAAPSPSSPRVRMAAVAG